MKLKEGSITLLFDHDGLRIELRDESACSIFANVRLSAENTCKALSRLSMTPCTIEVYNLDKIGKIHRHENLVFPMPSCLEYDTANLQEIARREVFKYVHKGWVPDLQFNSQNSFFDKNGKQYAQTHIRSWAEAEEMPPAPLLPKRTYNKKVVK